MVEHYTDEDFDADYIDKQAALRSSPCQPRDIELVTGDDRLTLAEQKELIRRICIDIRRAQGYPEVGISKNLIW